MQQGLTVMVFLLFLTWLEATAAGDAVGDNGELLACEAIALS